MSARETRRRLSFAGLISAGAGLALSGCNFGSLGSVDHVGDKRPRFDDKRNIQGGIAWVFSSGGPRGFVHVGVYKGLETLGLKPDLVVGASAGALVGTLIAAGLPAQRVEALAMELSPTAMFRLNIGGKERFDASGLSDLVNETLGGVMLEQLPIPVVCVAIKRASREVTLFNCGDPGVAVQASCAIEGKIAPVSIGGEAYMDPDWVQPLPVRVALRMGASKTLAVDASADEKRAPPGAERFAEQDQRKRALVQADAMYADHVLHPDIGYWANITAAYRSKLIRAGYEATLAHQERLLALHQRRA